MEPRSGFLQTRDGHNSSSRLLGFIVVLAALVLATVLIISGLMEGTSALIMIAASAGTLFTTIAGPAMVFMFSNKKEENNKTKDI